MTYQIPRWHDFDNDKPETHPTVPGMYVVMISGDSETDGPHVFYEYPDYETVATLHPADEEGHMRFEGVHDEEPEQIFAWYGPLAHEPYDRSKIASRNGELIAGSKEEK